VVVWSDGKFTSIADESKADLALSLAGYLTED
jgi:hypothetical protein